MSSYTQGLCAALLSVSKGPFWSLMFGEGILGFGDLGSWIGGLGFGF